MTTTDEIVLGEGVAIDSSAASVVMRAGSGAIDFTLYSLALSGVMWATEAPRGMLNQALATATLIAFTVFFYVIVPGTIESLTRGLSVGRLAVGLRIVRDDGGPISARYAFGRALLGYFEIFASFGMIAVVTSFLSAKGKRVGDIMVGTYAMRTRGGRGSLPPVAMPLGMADWAASADVTRLPDGLALTARLFLARAHQMSFDARYRLGTELVAQISPLVAPMPPAGTHPETFIAAVLATRRDREFAAGWRAEQANAAEYARLARLPFGVTDAET